MPLDILIILVVVGIAGIAVLTHLLGLSKPKTFLTEAQARAAWLREFPDNTVTSVTLCASAQAALIMTQAGPGIVWAMGADSTARLLNGATVSATETGLTVTLPDYGAPRIALCLTPDEALLWTNHIGAAA